jgi:hypothetical protein
VFQYVIHEVNNADNLLRQETGVIEPPIIYETWKMELKSASRSLLITINNITDFKLTLVNCVLSSGIFRSPVPTEIPPQTNLEFGAESHGSFAIKGHITYSYKNSKDPKYLLTINFDMSISSNQYSSEQFNIFERAIGNHSDIVYVFSSDEYYKLKEKRKKDPKKENKV